MSNYVFEGGYPTPETIASAYDDADYVRAVTCYKHFFPAVSGMSIFAGTERAGIVPNHVFGTMDTRPAQVGFTLNSDTPYGPILLDLSSGPFVVTLPSGPIIGAAMNTDQSWISDLGIPGPDQGRGGSHVFLPPGWEGDIAGADFTHDALGMRVVVGLRAIPQEGDVDGAIELLRSVQVAPLAATTDWEEPTWIQLTGIPQDTTPFAVQGKMGYWKLLHEYISTEPAYVGDVAYLGQLAVLGIQSGEPFRPDGRMTKILERAAADADAQMRVQSLANRRADREVWPGSKWEWVTLRPENPNFEIDGHTDVEAREVWFYQAIASSPVMFRRQAGSGSLYWFIGHDENGAYLDGANDYRIRVPLPVPAGLFWSLTVYDADTRSQIDTPQGNAALRSLFELDGLLSGDSIDLYFGPNKVEANLPWVQTLPGRGWFAYFRIYGPTPEAFDGAWQPSDPVTL